MTVSFQSGHDGASVNLDVLDLLDAIHEVSRHALSQIPAARDDVHASGISRQRHDGLSSRIAGAHELTETRQIEPAILHTRRDKDGLAANLRAVAECDDANAGIDPETLDG